MPFVLRSTSATGGRVEVRLCRHTGGLRIAGVLLAILAAGLVFDSSASGEEDSSAKAPLQSGLRVGEKVPQFYVRAITGPLKTRSVCYVCRNGDRPVVMLVVRKVTPELTALLKKIDAVVDEKRAVGLRSFGVFLTQDNKALGPQLQTLAFDEQISLPLTIAAAPTDGPAGESSHPDAVVTVLLYREQHVRANFTFREGELGTPQIEAIIRSIRNLADEEAPGTAPAVRPQAADGSARTGA